MGFTPVTYKDPAYLKDPKVCNIKNREYVLASAAHILKLERYRED